MKSSSSDRPQSLVQRVARGERQRKWFAIFGIGAVALIAVLTYLVVVLYVERGDARRYYNDQLQMIVCAIPPGDDIGDLLRARASCGPYVAPTPTASAERPAPTRKPRATPTRTVTGEVRLVPQPRTAPRSRTPAREPRTTRTATVTPRPARTVTRPPVTRTATPSPSGTRGLLPGLLCTVLGCD